MTKYKISTYIDGFAFAIELFAKNDWEAMEVFYRLHPELAGCNPQITEVESGHAM